MAFVVPLLSAAMLRVREGRKRHFGFGTLGIFGFSSLPKCLLVPYHLGTRAPLRFLFPDPQRTHILRLLGQKTVCLAFGLFWMLRGKGTVRAPASDLSSIRGERRAGLGFRVLGLGFRGLGLGFRV